MPRLTLLLMVIFCVALSACAHGVAQNTEPRDLDVRRSWSGDYPVAALDQLPAGQQQNRVGYLGDAASFARVWQNFLPSEALPEIDFNRELVVFSRNVDFYNRTNIFKVTVTAGVVDILAMETMSARPIEAQVAMALAVVARDGIKAIRIDETRTQLLD